jgi:hypothetical protein
MTGDTVCGYYEDPFRGLVATVCLDRDSPEAREQIHKDLDARFPGKPHRLVLHRADGTRVALRGDCRNGCCCGCATCKGRPRNRPPQAGARTRPGRRPPPVGSRVVAEDLGDDDYDTEDEGLPDTEHWADDDPMMNGGETSRRRKPAEPATPEDTEALHQHLLSLVAALISHVHHTRGREGRKELADAVGTLPRTLGGEQVRRTAEAVLAETAPRRVSPARRKQFLAWHGIH